ncbi:MAG: phosphoenolpyruvate carboxykinase (ATP), partial [Chloroflexota bacterium]
MPLQTVQHPRSNKVDLDAVGIKITEGYSLVHWNLNPPEIIEFAIKLGEGHQTNDGALRILTGQFTGRSPKDKYFVEEPSSKDKIWWGEINQPTSQELFDHMYGKVQEHLSLREHLFVMDLFCGTDPEYRLPVRIVSEVAYHAIFARNMFVRPTQEELLVHEPEWTVMAAPTLVADPHKDGTKT